VDFVKQILNSLATPMANAAVVPLRPEERHAGLIEAAARKHNVDPNLVRSVIKVESNFDQNRVSPAGAVGIMQLMPRTAKGMNINPYDVNQNIYGGVQYLSQLIDRFKGDYKAALAAYNAGPTNYVRSGGDINRLPKETREYVPKVMGYFKGGIE
jgi:soluble lytic murein transglycosylase-like protein